MAPAPTSASAITSPAMAKTYSAVTVPGSMAERSARMDYEGVRGSGFGGAEAEAFEVCLRARASAHLRPFTNKTIPAMNVRNAREMSYQLTWRRQVSLT